MLRADFPEMLFAHLGTNVANAPRYETGGEDMIGRDLDFDLHNAIQDLIAEGLLEENSDPHRVARIVIHDGYDSLTPAQQALYDAVVTPALGSEPTKLKARDLEWQLPRAWTHKPVSRVGSRQA
jgi:hypothetical protein